MLLAVVACALLFMVSEKHALCCFVFVGLKAAFDAFASELCVLGPRMLLLGDRRSNSNSGRGGGGGGEIVQTSLRFVYEQLGVRTLSPTDLVHLHILPALKCVLSFLSVVLLVYRGHIKYVTCLMRGEV